MNIKSPLHNFWHILIKKIKTTQKVKLKINHYSQGKLVKKMI